MHGNSATASMALLRHARVTCHVAHCPRNDNVIMYRRSGLVISREQVLRYDAGFAVAVLMS